MVKPTVVVVSGPAGSGKTTMAHAPSRWPSVVLAFAEMRSKGRWSTPSAPAAILMRSSISSAEGGVEYSGSPSDLVEATVPSQKGASPRRGPSSFERWARTRIGSGDQLADTSA